MTHLYRHFDASGRLLYVGISDCLLVRLWAHEHRSHWFNDVHSITVQRFPTRAAALQAEREAVRAENPVFNKNLRPKPAKVKEPRRITRRMRTPNALRKLGFPSTLTFDDEIWPMLDALRANGYNLGVVLLNAVSEWLVRKGYARKKDLVA